MNPETRVRVRSLHAEDIEGFLGLVEALAAYEHLAPPDAAARARLSRDALATPPRFSVLLADLGGRLVGYAVYFETYSTFLALPTLYLEDLFVLPDERAHGVGRALFDACAAEAVSHGCGRLEWQVLAWNDLAIGFYQHLGAQPLHADWQSYRLEGSALAAAADQELAGRNVPVHELADRVYLIEQHLAAPEAVTPLNAFVVRAEQPLVVDTSGPPRRDAFLTDLRSIVALESVRYVAITHADPDHTGALAALLEAAPVARVLTNAMGQTKLMGDFGIPAERFALVGPGDVTDLGNRQVSTQTTPLFDQPETMGFFDERARVFFAADCFGAILPRLATFADEVEEKLFQRCFMDWNRVNHPWVRLVDPAKFAHEIDLVRGLRPSTIASSHGPVIRRSLERAYAWLEQLPHVAASG